MPGKVLPALLLAVVSLAPFAVPGGAQAQPLQFGACPAPPDGVPDAGQQCATLQVPLDYADPNGRKIAVAVSRVRAANPVSRRGVLLLNPGGPGGSGLDLPELFAQLLPRSVLDRYDLIGFDPRFVGASTVDPDWVWRQQFRAWGSAGTIRFPDFAGFAAANNATYHLGKNATAVRNLYLHLLQRLKSHPVHFQNSDVVLNGALFQEITF